MPFGDPFLLRSSNSGGAYRATAVPLKLLAHIRYNPAPITISGTNQVVFTLNASVTEPFIIWAGDDFLHLDRSLAYTWGSTTNNILGSDGSASTVTGSTLGVWYFYVNRGGTTLRPSQTEPKYIEGANDGYPSVLGHPGTSAATTWLFVGLHVNTTAATPVFRAMTKKGYTYYFARQNVATTSGWAELDFSASIPKDVHGLFEVGGEIELPELSGGTQVWVEVGTSATTGQAHARFDLNGTTTNVADITAKAPFGGVPPTANGKVYARDSGSRGDVHISWIKAPV